MCAKLGLGTPAPLAAAAEEAADAAAGWVGATPAGGGSGAGPPSPPRPTPPCDSTATSPGAWGASLTYDVEVVGDGGDPHPAASGSLLLAGEEEEEEAGGGQEAEGGARPAAFTHLATAEAARSSTPAWAAADRQAGPTLNVHRRLYEEAEEEEGTVDGAVDDASD